MRRYTFYSESVKKAVVHEVKTGRITKEEARRRYNIRSSTSISNWIRKFEGQTSSRPNQMDYKNKSKEDLIKRIKELERQLEDEQIRSFGYSKMIDIAEDQLKVQIRKKPDTKRSKK